MERIKKFIKIKKELARETERGELFKYFMETINPHRKAAGYKALNYARMGKILEGLDMHTLYYMKSMMSGMEKESGVKWFWWSLRNEEEKSI